MKIGRKGRKHEETKTKDEQYENEKKNTRYGRKPYSNQHKWWTMAWVALDTIMVEPLGWRWRRELHGRVWVSRSKVNDEGCSWNSEWKVSNELYLREDRGRWLEEMIQSSSSSDSQK